MVLVVQLLRLLSRLNLLPVTIAVNALCSISFIISDNIVVDIHVDWYLYWLIKVALLLKICLLIQLLLTLVSMKPDVLILLSFCLEDLMLARIDVVFKRAAVFMLLEVMLV